MKSLSLIILYIILIVTLHVRVWIEMTSVPRAAVLKAVTLHVRVWIEIRSRTARSRKLRVTLHVRVWIEIARTASILRLVSRHPPREGVD